MRYKFFAVIGLILIGSAWACLRPNHIVRVENGGLRRIEGVVISMSFSSRDVGALEPGAWAVVGLKGFGEGAFSVVWDSGSINVNCGYYDATGGDRFAEFVLKSGMQGEVRCKWKKIE